MRWPYFDNLTVRTSVLAYVVFAAISVSRFRIVSEEIRGLSGNFFARNSRSHASDLGNELPEVVRRPVMIAVRDASKRYRAWDIEK